MLAFIDIETTGLDLNDDILAIGLITMENDYRLVTDINELKNYKLVGHNIKFDVRRINHHYGLDLEPFLDTIIIAYLDNPHLKSYGLKTLITKIFKVPNWSEDTNGLLNKEGKRAKSFGEITYLLKNKREGDLWDSMLEYLEKDVRYTKLLFSLINNLSNKEIELAHFLTKLDYLIDTKLEPFYIDTFLLDKVSKETSQKINDLKTKMPKINYNASKQVADLFTKEGIIINTYTSKGAKSVGKESITQLMLDYPNNELIMNYTELKKLEKLKSAFLEPWAKLNGKMSPRFSLIGTKTGRTSCSKPNIQQIPKGSVRNLFIAPQGYDLVEADYSQMELRIAGEVAQVQGILNAFKDDEDLHSVTARSLFGDNFTEKQRNSAKVANFGLLYGMGSQGYQKYALTWGLQLTLKECTDIKLGFFNAYPELTQYYENVRKDLRIKGYTESPTGRRFKVDPITFRYGDRHQDEQTAINARIQGYASDLLLYSLHKILTHPLYGDEFKVFGMIHDSILFYIKKGSVVAQGIIEDAMLNHEGVNVPLKVDYENKGERWN